MRISDKNLRHQAIPYNGQIFGYNRSENSDQDISKTLPNPDTYGIAGASTDPSLSGFGDLYNIVNNVSGTDYMIRILRPKFGQIIQAYLSISITFDWTEVSPYFNVCVGYGFDTDNITPLVPPLSYVTECMTYFNPPSGAPFSGAAGEPLSFLLNIQPLIPQVGQTNYNQDFYSVGVHFVRTPKSTGIYHVNKFSVTGSVMVV